MNGMPAPSRLCVRQPESSPNSTWNTAAVCVTIRIGDSRIENSVSVTTPSTARVAPQVLARMPRALDLQREAEELRHQHDEHGGEEQPQGGAGVGHRPHGEQRLLVDEVARDHLLALQGEHDADGERRRPDQRHEIGRGAHQQMQTAHGRDAGREDDAEVLQVALRPAPVARDDVGQRRRLALVGAFDRRHHVHAPVGAGEQHRLDEVVALDVAAERRACPGSVGRPAAEAKAAVRMMALWPQ